MEKELEFISMVLTIIGATLMSLSKENDTKYLGYSYLFFSLANSSLLYVLSQNNMPIMFLITVLSAYLSFLGIRMFYSSNMAIIFLLISAFSFFYSLYSFDNSVSFVMSDHIVEMIAGSITMVGNIIMLNKDNNAREKAILIFLIGDAVCVVIGINNNLSYYAIQNIFYILTSVLAFYNNNGTICRSIKLNNLKV
jgi:hypothetical protein